MSIVITFLKKIKTKDVRKNEHNHSPSAHNSIVCKTICPWSLQIHSNKVNENLALYYYNWTCTYIYKWTYTQTKKYSRWKPATHRDF